MQRFVDENILVQSNQTIKQTKWKVCNSQKTVFHCFYTYVQILFHNNHFLFCALRKRHTYI